MLNLRCGHGEGERGEQVADKVVAKVESEEVEVKGQGIERNDKSVFWLLAENFGRKGLAASANFEETNRARRNERRMSSNDTGTGRWLR